MFFDFFIFKAQLNFNFKNRFSYNIDITLDTKFS